MGERTRRRAMPRTIQRSGLLTILAITLIWTGCKSEERRQKTTAPPPARTTRPPERKPRQARGARCTKHDECARPLRCVDGKCVDVAPEPVVCKWATFCLKALTKSNNPDANRGAATKLHAALKARLNKANCLQMAMSGIARTQPPDVWKPLCGPPPTSGIVKVNRSKPPLRVIESQIKASNIPRDDPFYKKRTRPGHLPDQCKAWVRFQVTRRFQGRIRAVFYREHDCKKVQAGTGGTTTSRLGCKLKRYERTDSYHYLYLTYPREMSLNFYVETPYEVCKHRVKKRYPSGCFCSGLSSTRITLEPVEDTFLHPVDFERERMGKNPATRK
jgi:hypothetical protein